MIIKTGARGGSSKLETRCWSENQRQTEGFEPSVTHCWPTPVKTRKKCCYGQKDLGQYTSLSPSPAYLSHTTNITLSKMKFERLYFYKDIYLFVIEVVFNGWWFFPHIFVYVYVQFYVCGYTTLVGCIPIPTVAVILNLKS